MRGRGWRARGGEEAGGGLACGLGEAPAFGGGGVGIGHSAAGFFETGQGDGAGTAGDAGLTVGFHLVKCVECAGDGGGGSPGVQVVDRAAVQVADVEQVEVGIEVVAQEGGLVEVLGRGVRIFCLRLWSGFAREHGFVEHGAIVRGGGRVVGMAARQGRRLAHMDGHGRGKSCVGGREGGGARAAGPFVRG